MYKFLNKIRQRISKGKTQGYYISVPKEIARMLSDEEYIIEIKEVER